MDRPIVPLFNISKRPRQAVVSDPCDSQSSAPRQPLSNTGYVGNTNQRPGAQLGNQPKSRPVNNQMNLLPPKPSLPQYNAKRDQQPGPYADGPGGGMKQCKGSNSRPYGDGPSGLKQSRGYNSFNTAQQKPSNTGGQMQRQYNNTSQRATYNYSGSNKQVIELGQPASSGNNYQRNIGMNKGMNTHQTGFNNRQTISSNSYGINKPVSSRMNSPKGSRGSTFNTQTNNTAQPSTLPRSSGSTFNTQTYNTAQPSTLPRSSGSTFNTQAYNRAQLQPPAASVNPQQSTSYSTTPGKPLPKYGSTKASTDKSLRVFTASVQSVIQWGNNKHAIPALFEVYGIVDSPVMMNHFTQGKQFMLKDETGVIQCIFFEIDRGLERLTRGQWHRCMGAFDPKLERFKCVSVRQSSPSERSLAKLSIKTSDEAMKTLIRELRES